MSELPPNERPPQEANDTTQTLLWTIVGVIVVLGILAGGVGGFMGGRIFNAVRTVTDAEVMRLFGALPTDEDDRVILPEVDPSGPAWRGGLASGDVLLRLDETDITNADQAKRTIAGYTVGQRILVTYERDFRPAQTEVVIGVGRVGDVPTPTAAPLPTRTAERPTPVPPQPGQQRENAQLGIVYRSIGEQDGDRYGTEAGAIVISTTVNGPADLAGMQIGDIILGVGNIDLSDEMNLQRALSGFNAGQQIKVRVLRDGAEELLDVTLGR